MKGQIKMDLSDIPKISNTKKYDTQKWRNALQEYCDYWANTDSANIEPYCVCGYMNYCDYCKGVINSNACVKAICEVAKIKNIEINIYDYNFEKLIKEIEE